MQIGHRVGELGLKVKVGILASERFYCFAIAFRVSSAPAPQLLDPQTLRLQGALLKRSLLFFFRRK